MTIQLAVIATAGAIVGFVIWGLSRTPASTDNGTVSDAWMAEFNFKSGRPQ